MEPTQIIEDLKAKIAASEERTERLRRMLQDFTQEYTGADAPVTSNGNGAGHGVGAAPTRTSPRIPPPQRGRRRRRPPNTTPTIKQLMVAVLREAAERNEGLSPVAIRVLIREKTLRDVNRKSISAQLTHMKADGEVRHGDEGLWWWIPEEDR